jgi:hypothetical protein
MSLLTPFRLAKTFLVVVALLAVNAVPTASHAQFTPRPRTYLGFDSNEYPGDENLVELRKTFAFVGYWLTPPPGAKTNPWEGKRHVVSAQGFGFLLLFNGRLEAELKQAQSARVLGEKDALGTAYAAWLEGFPPGSVIFLDQEEGGRLTQPQMDYVQGWISGIAKRGFVAGVYCSGIAVKDGKEMITTAEDIRAHANGVTVKFFVYNDACPPSPGCAYKAPSPADSGTEFADVWQFAQSPRRKEYTSRCAATYSKDGNCHPAAGANAAVGGALLDLDSATTADPSQAR